MPKCSFTGREIPPGTGIMFVKKDGKVLWFLDSKAEKGYNKLHRKPRNVRWTEEARAAKAAALASGSKLVKEAKAPKRAAKPAEDTE